MSSPLRRLAVGSLALTLVAAAVGAAQGATRGSEPSTPKLLAETGTRVTTLMTTRQQVPAPLGKLTRATGTFSGTLTPDRRLTWTLSFKGLSGPLVSATIRVAPRGKPGPDAVPLCHAPCKSPAAGIFLVSPKAAAAIRTGRAYVSLRTRRNPRGEIRGQLGRP